jgi:TRAP-type C4-dicarboxylate transport system permease small subunit
LQTGKLEGLSGVLGGGVRMLAIASGVVLLGLMVLTVVAVTLRKFNYPIVGTQDLSEAGLTIVVFFAMAYSGWTGGHIAVDLISGVLKGGGLRILDTVVRFCCGAFFVIVAWQSVRQGLDALEFGDGFNLVDIPHYPFFFVVAFGSGLYALVLLVLTARSALGLADPERP